VRRLLLTILFATSILAISSVAHAQEGPASQEPEATQNTQGEDNLIPPAAPENSGPSLIAKQQPTVACDPAATRLRFLEVRGSGFDSWALQRLTSRLVDAGGTPLMSWGSVWVSARGQLTLEVNLCADPFSGRGPLPSGTYGLLVSPRDGAPIASTTLEIASLPVEVEDTAAPADDTP